jgi:hypothetical protein
MGRFLFPKVSLKCHRPKNLNLEYSNFWKKDPNPEELVERTVHRDALSANTNWNRSGGSALAGVEIAGGCRRY